MAVPLAAPCGSWRRTLVALYSVVVTIALLSRMPAAQLSTPASASAGLTLRWHRAVAARTSLPAPAASALSPTGNASPRESADVLEPPAWLLAGRCSPPDDLLAANTSSAAAFNASACPLREDGGGSVGYDGRPFADTIAASFAPWRGADTKISHAALDAAWSHVTANLPPSFHFSLSGGEVFYRQQGPASAYDSQLFDMLKTASRLVRLPDVEFLMHPWDHQKVPRQDPVPVFGFTRGPASNDIIFPYAYAWRAGGFGLEAAQCGADRDRLAHRSHERAMWRGGCTGPSAAEGYLPALAPFYLRYRATAQTARRPDVLDAGLVRDCINRTLSPPLPPLVPEINLGAAGSLCDYRHLVLIDGNTASGRSSVWVHAGAAVIKPHSIWREWYYDALTPWVHYVPAQEFLGDLPEKAAWLIDHPAAAQCLADNLRRVARRYVSTEGVVCFIWQLLTQYAELQTEGARGADRLPPGFKRA